MATVLNPTQQFLLKMFQYNQDEESLNELKEVWLKHVQNKVDEEMEKVWQEKNLSDEKLLELGNSHFRTPYRR
jgi:23S rRNA U2552 (ribose-2'-O)-methylase RlmE/FtsJ